MIQTSPPKKKSRADLGIFSWHGLGGSKRPDGGGTRCRSKPSTFSSCKGRRFPMQQLESPLGVVSYSIPRCLRLKERLPLRSAKLLSPSRESDLQTSDWQSRRFNIVYRSRACDLRVALH